MKYQLAPLALSLILSGCLRHPQRDPAGAAFFSEPYDRMAVRLSAGHRSLSSDKIAVLPFSYVDGRTSGDGAVISERLLTRIINRGQLEAVERALLDKVMGELKFQRSGSVDDRTIKNLGKILGVEAIVTGTLIRHRNGRLEINARLIRTETASILAAAGEVVIPDWETAPAKTAPPAEKRPAPQPQRPAAKASPTAKDPVRWWRAEGDAMDEITGFSGSPANGTTFIPGVSGQAFSLDGRDDYVSAGYEPIYDSLFDGRHPFSFSFWIKNSGKNSPQGIFSKGEDPVITSLYMNNASYNYGLTFNIKNGHGSKLEAGALAEGPAPGRWEHWVASYDGSLDVAGMKIYRNGALQPLSSLTNSFGDNIMTNPSPLEFGRIGGGLNWHFQGQLDDIRLYNRVLAPAEVSALASIGEPKYAAAGLAAK